MDRWYVLLVVALLCVLPIQSVDAGDDHINVQLKWVHDFQFAGFYMALEKGYYRDEGLDVTLIEGGSGQSSIEYVVGNPTAYAVTSTGALLERSYGKPIKAVGAIFQHSPLMLLTRTDMGIENIGDLRGKRIMLQQGYQNVGIIAALQKVGLMESDFIRQDISYNLNDLIEKRTDAYAVYATNQPHPLAVKKIAYHIFDPVKQGIDFYGDIIITSDEEVRKHPERVRAFMQATSRGWVDAFEHPDEAIDLILLKYNSQQLTRAHLQFEAAESVKFMQPTVVKPGYMNMFRWQRIAQVYIAQGFLEAGFPLEEFVYLPQPSLTDFIKDHLWQALLGIFILISTFLGGGVFTLRRLVQRKTEDLNESESNYRSLLELADIGIVVHSGGRILFANAYALQCFQATSWADVSGDDVMQYVHPDDRADAIERIQKVVLNGQGYTHVPARYIGKLGRCIDAEAGSLLIQYHGEPAVLTVIVDVTERNHLAIENTNIQKKMEHTQRLESLGILAGGIAHDFNNLLAVILGYTEMAILQTNDNPDIARDHLAHVVKASENAASLCNQMLAYSGFGKLVVESISLSQTVKEMLDLIDVVIDEKVNLTYHMQENIPLIEGDASQLQQIIMNLVTNAAESMPSSGGELMVYVGAMHADASYLDACQHENLLVGDFVYIEVKDTGCGMDKQVREKLFEPFFTTKFTGRGLGMSAMLGIVRGHHGGIHIESQVNKGTSIRVLFPCAHVA